MWIVCFQFSKFTLDVHTKLLRIPQILKPPHHPLLVDAPSRHSIISKSIYDTHSTDGKFHTFKRINPFRSCNVAQPKEKFNFQTRTLVLLMSIISSFRSFETFGPIKRRIRCTLLYSKQTVELDFTLYFPIFRSYRRVLLQSFPAAIEFARWLLERNGK